MARENYQARLEDVDAKRVEQFREEENIETKAEATRRLIRLGLDKHEDVVKADGGQLREAEKQIEQTRSDVDALSETTQQQNYGLIAGFVWLLTETAVGIPGALLTVGTGLVVLGALLYPAIQRRI